MGGYIECYEVYLVYLLCMYGVYTCITSVHRCMYGNEGCIKGVYMVYTMMGSYKERSPRRTGVPLRSILTIILYHI